MSGVVPRTGQVSMSCINAVRLCKTNQQGRIVENPSTGFKGSQNFYRNQAAMRGFVGNDEGLKLSEFRAAQIITACIRTKSETYKFYYGTNDDGKILACIQVDTVNADGAVRYYGYRLDNGAYQICTNNNQKTWSGLQGGGDGGCGGTQFASGCCRNYTVRLKDNVTQANIGKNVQVFYNAGDRLYSCIQTKDGTVI
jgi:hypothetical protein